MRTLTDAEVERLSFMHFYLATENEPDSQRSHFAEWSIDMEARRMAITVPGAALKQDPLVLLNGGRITVSAWLHLEVFRWFPDVGWATETRRPPNPIGTIHHLLYAPRTMLKMTGYGRDPAARYLYLFDNPQVTAEFSEDEDQERLRQQHRANFERRKQSLLNDPREASLRIHLDKEDKQFLNEIIDRARISGGRDHGQFGALSPGEKDE